MDLEIGAEDPWADDVREVLEAHLAFARSVTPAEGVFALDPSALIGPAITLFGARHQGALVGVGALSLLAADHAELKSMHTVAAARAQGVGRALVEHLVSVARSRGCTRVSLETGNLDAFAPARSLYAACGFVECALFGPYVGSTTSVCMTLALG
jgi:putative acetyltransferase